MFSGDGRTLATLNPEGGLDVWDVKTRTRRQTHAAGPGSRWHPALSFDGRWFATTTGPGDSENLIHVRETATGRLHGVLAGHKQTPLAVAFAPDGRTLASSGHDSTLKLWNVASSQELLSFRRPGVFFSRLLFSPDGRWLVAGRGFGASGSMQLLHAPAGEETGTSSAAKATPAPPAPTATDDPASK